MKRKLTKPVMVPVLLGKDAQGRETFGLIGDSQAARAVAWKKVNRTYTVAYVAKSGRRGARALCGKVQERAFKTAKAADEFVARNRTKWEFHRTRIDWSLIGK